MGYLGYKPADKPLTSADITDGIIVNADIANSTIDLTTKVTGTLPTTKGGTGLATLGTASQELRVNSGATALEYYTPTVASSDYVLLATTDITSSTASVSFDGYFSSTYKNYQIIISQAIPVTNDVTFYARFRRSNADITSANYYSSICYNYRNPSVGINGATGGWGTSAAWITEDTYASNITANGGTSAVVNIFNPLSTTSYKTIQYTFSNMYQTATAAITGITMNILRDSTAALSGFTFYFSSGNIASGNFKLYGIK
jgi:hypothetical protein